jgi:DNA polymerase III gamma/tau subunit
MTSLHTKYRPTTLDEVVGQDHIKKAIAAVLAEGQQQAFMFDGPSGTGKTTLARLCASELSCSNIIEVDAASHTGVDAMREIASRANFASLDGGGKAFIVDECHRLSKQAWESLLKAIEEPPAGVFWFFCTTEPDRVLPTIRTRCVTFSLKDVPYRAILRLVASVAKKEGIELLEEILDVAAYLANGSPRQALVNLAIIKHCTSSDEAREALNRARGSAEAVHLARALSKKDWTTAFKALRSIKDEPESVRLTVFHYFVAIFMREQNAPDPWVLTVLGQFETPSVERNKMGDILLRVARCQFKARS